jgi:hypothetical protein
MTLEARRGPGFLETLSLLKRQAQTVQSVNDGELFSLTEKAASRPRALSDRASAHH